MHRRFVELASEDTPLIRKGCAFRIGNFALQLDKEHIIADLIPAFKQLAADEQDGIRVLCIEGLIKIAGRLTKEDNQRHILPMLLTSSEDKSWKVRLSIAKNFTELSKAFGKEITDGNLVAKFAQLLKDVEADVRTAGVISLKDCVRNIGVEKVQSILFPALQSLVQDSSFNVKGKICFMII